LENRRILRAYAAASAPSATGVAPVDDKSAGLGPFQAAIWRSMITLLYRAFGKAFSHWPLDAAE